MLWRLCSIAVLSVSLGALCAAPTAAEIPIELREGLVWVKAVTPGSAETLNLLIDTGAAVSVINSSTARRLGARFGRRVSVRGVGATLQGHFLAPLSIKAGEIQLPARYLAIDLTRLSRSCGGHLDGLIGADFFQERIVQIDFQQHRIRMVPPGAAPSSGDVLPLEVRPCGMRVPIKVDGARPQWVRLDTGCASGLQWVTERGPRAAGSAKTCIGLAAVDVPQIRSTVELGTRKFRDVPTGLHAKPIFPGEAGLLGNALLSQFSTVTIDTIGGRLLLQPGRTP